MITAAAGAVPVTYSRDWILFTEWCTAFELEALPASTVTVARFLDFEPHVAASTLRRRVTAINYVHQTSRHTAPGTVTAIRVLLSTRDRQTARVAGIIRTLPTSGWPSAMFGRRDALILTLTCTVGLPVPATAALASGDLTYHPETHNVHIGAGHNIDTSATTDPYGLYAVWRRWAVVRDRMIRYPSPRAWASALRAAETVVDAEHNTYTSVVIGPPEPQRPGAALFPALDRWGQPRHLNPAESISARTVSHVLATYLNPTTRPRISPPPHQGALHRIGSTMTGDDPQAFAPILAAPAVDGAAARRHAVEHLDTPEPVYVDIDARTTDLLARVEKLLQDWRLAR